MADVNILMVIGCLITSTASLDAKAGPQQEALQKASLAFYKQSGMETQVNKQFNQYKDHYIPRPVQYYLTNTAILVDAISKQKVSYSWDF